MHEPRQQPLAWHPLDVGDVVQVDLLHVFEAREPRLERPDEAVKKFRGLVNRICLGEEGTTCTFVGRYNYCVGFEAVAGNHRGKLVSGGWTLCIGAGISRGLVPTWFELCNTLVNESFGADLDNAQFTNLTNSLGWSLDSWIQASANQFQSAERSMDEFHELLAEILYGGLRRAARSHGLESHLILALKNPKNISKKKTVELAGSSRISTETLHCWRWQRS